MVKNFVVFLCDTESAFDVYDVYTVNHIIVVSILTDSFFFQRTVKLARVQVNLVFEFHVQSFKNSFSSTSL